MLKTVSLGIFEVFNAWPFSLIVDNHIELLMVLTGRRPFKTATVMTAAPWMLAEEFYFFLFGWLVIEIMMIRSFPGP